MENFARTARRDRLALQFRPLHWVKTKTAAPGSEAGSGGGLGQKRNGDNAGQDAIRVWHGRTGHFADRRATGSRSMQKSEEHL